MIFKKPEEIEAELKALEDEKATFHRWNDTVLVKGTGKFDPRAGNGLPKGKVFKVHSLVAPILVKKGYVTLN